MDEITKFTLQMCHECGFFQIWPIQHEYASQLMLSKHYSIIAYDFYDQVGCLIQVEFPCNLQLSLNS